MKKALSILAIILFAGAAHAVDSERTFITPPGADPLTYTTNSTPSIAPIFKTIIRRAHLSGLPNWCAAPVSK
jgi:hypothetical protein